MNLIFKLFVTTITVTIVIGSRDSDLDCVRKGIDAMHREAKGSKSVKDDKVLLESAQHNLKVGIDMITKRTQRTKLDCYYDFTKKYSNGLKQISDELKDRVAKARDQNEKSEAISTIATMSQVMKCDEEHRAKHLNESIECTRIEEFGSSEAKFNSLYNILRGRLFLNTIMESNKNKVIDGIINYDLQMYSKLYGEAKNCVSRQRKIDRCPNLKILVDELERFFYLFDLLVV